MTYQLTWLADVLRAAGLTVIERPNWRTRGHGDMGRPIGVMCHHIAGAGPKSGPISKADLSTVTGGRPGLPGPLCNLALSRDGTFYTVAAGRAYHAGVGSWKGVRDGNHHYIGIEAAQTGYIQGPTAEIWTAEEVDAYARGCAAILDFIKQPYTQCIGHKEWAPHRKSDPTFNMNQFRDGVHFYMDNPKGTWTGALDRMAARLTRPKDCQDGCCDVQVGSKSDLVLPA